MTLALYGKTKRRRAALLLGAVLAALFAMVGGALFGAGGDAGATPPPPTTGNIQVHKYLPKDNPSDAAPWVNQGKGQGTWTFSVYDSLAEAQAGTGAIATFDNLGSNSPDLPLTELWLKETGMPAGYQFFGWFVPDGDNNSGNDKCSQEPLDGSTLNTSAILNIPASYWTTKGNQTGLFHVCAYNKPTPTTRTLRIIKLTDTATHPAATFNGTILPYESTSAEPFTVSLAANASTSSVVTKTVSTAELLLTETPIPTDWSLVGYNVAADPSGTATCNPAATYSKVEGSIVVPSGTANYIVCIKNTYTPPVVGDGTIRISKDDNAGHAVGGATFKLVLGSTTLCVTDNQGTPNAIPACAGATPRADENSNAGRVVLTKLELGTWHVYEVGVPLGYGPDTCGGERIAPLTASAKDWAIGGAGCTAGSPGWTAFHNPPLEKSITFSKYICEDYANVPANQPGGQDDIGKLDEPGKTHADLGAENPVDPNAPAVPGSFPGCTLATDPWTIRLWTSDRSNGSGGTMLQEVTIPAGGQTTVALNSAALRKALEAPGLYVEEVYRAGYGFGALKCYTDHLNDDNWEWLDFSGGIPEGAVYCTAFNVPASGNVIVHKVTTGYEDGTLFAGTLLGDKGQNYTFSGLAIGGQTAPIKVKPGTYGIEETGIPAGWAFIGAGGNLEQACSVESASLTGLYEFTVAPGETEHVYVCNEAYANLEIVKVDGINGATGPLWDFTIAPAQTRIDGSTLDGGSADQGTKFTEKIRISGQALTVTEALDGGPWETCQTAGDYYTTAVVPADVTPSTPGETITFTFSNQPCGVLGTGGLIIEKYLDINGDGDAGDPGEGPLAGWTFTTTGGGIPLGNQVRTTNASGQVLEYIAGFDGGTVLNVAETQQAGYDLKRVTLNGVNVGSSLANNITITPGQVKVLRYFNQPLGSIKVNKATYHTVDNITTPVPQDRDGWKITVTSATCGITRTAFTDAAGNATFENLPLCSDWVVAEDLAAPGATGYTPVGAASVANVTPGLKQPVEVNFVNEKRSTTPPPCDGPCENPTPEPPTATPVTPVIETPVVPVKPTEPPPSATAVLGERTPGPGSPTPIVPSTGDSQDGTGNGLNIAFVAAALALIAAGLGARAMTRRR